MVDEVAYVLNFVNTEHFRLLLESFSKTLINLG